MTTVSQLEMYTAYSQWLEHDAQARDDDGEPQRAAFRAGWDAREAASTPQGAPTSEGGA